MFWFLVNKFFKRPENIIFKTMLQCSSKKEKFPKNEINIIYIHIVSL